LTNAPIHTSSHKAGPTPAHLRSVLREIVEGGATLPPERELVEKLKVPRSRLRRVLAKMRLDGLLPPAQIGRRATREDGFHADALARLANPTDVIELRLILEPEFARLAAVRASALEIGRIIKSATTAPDENYGKADLTFHVEIANASRNALGREFYNILRQVGADSRVHLPSKLPMCPKRKGMRDAEHKRIAQAIAERDPERSADSMRSHLLTVQSIIMERISPDHLDIPLYRSMTAGE